MLNNQKAKEKDKDYCRHRVLKPVRNASPFLLLLDLEQFIRPAEPVFRIDKTK